MDLIAPQSELMVQTATLRGKPRVAEAVQHVPEQGGKLGAVQTITTEPFVGSKGGVEVVIHLSKTMKEMNQHFIHRTETMNQKSKINHSNSKTLTQILFSANDNLTKLC
jgi:hypothetical protein